MKVSLQGLLDMDISIIIVSYNTKGLLIGCLDSIVKDNSKIEKEIIIVDNASKDDSVRAAEDFAIKSKIDLKIIRNKTNVGFSKANNQGIKKASGKYILLINSDTRVEKKAFEKLINFAQKHPDAGVIGAKLLNEDGSVQESCFNFPTIKRAVNQYWLRKDNKLDKFAPLGKDAVQVDAVVGASFFITPKAVKEIGGLDERYFFYYEDLAYCRNVWKKGLKVYYLPTVKVFHYHGASGKSIAKESDQWRRLIPSSKIYHGVLKHYLFNFILWSGQKWQKLIKS